MSWIASLVVSGTICVAYFVYQYARHRRSRLTGEANTRVVGVVVPSRSPVPLTCNDVVVETITGGRYRASCARSSPTSFVSGARVVVIGKKKIVLANEALYREQSREMCIDDARVVRAWPELRALWLPVAVSCVIWLFSLSQLLFSSTFGGRLFH